jgi:pyruvate dehydrogenase E2 component (dihydrolipoamide acetyltransferase)
MANITAQTEHADRVSRINHQHRRSRLEAEPFAACPVAAEPVAAWPVAADPVAAWPVEAEPVPAPPVDAGLLVELAADCPPTLFADEGMTAPPVPTGLVAASA